jgi:hypothetical protein
MLKLSKFDNFYQLPCIKMDFDKNFINGGFIIANKYAMEYLIERIDNNFFNNIKEIKVKENNINIFAKILLKNELFVSFPYDINNFIEEYEIDLELESSLLCVKMHLKLIDAIRCIINKYKLKYDINCHDDEMCDIVLKNIVTKYIFYDDDSDNNDNCNNNDDSDNCDNNDNNDNCDESDNFVILNN